MKQKGIKNTTFIQRLQIETLNNAKHTKMEIAKTVGVSIRTVFRELQRGKYEHLVKSSSFWYGDKYKKEIRYSAQLAQERYEYECTKKGRPLKIGNDFEFVHYFETRVKNEKITPFAILGQIKKNNIHFKTDISRTTLYKYIRMGLFENINMSPRKKKYERVVAKRAPRGTSIERRPEEVGKRNTFGNWEMDCICGKDKSVLLTLAERLTRKVIIFPMQNQKAKSVIECLDTLERRYGQMFKKVFKTITVDNGCEFSDFVSLERSCFGGRRTKVFYCHPYSSWERGTNERLNREIRRIIPKGSVLSRYSIEDIQQVEDWCNNYPRKIFNFATSKEIFEEQMKHLE